jgi:hypothetical protein
MTVDLNNKIYLGIVEDNNDSDRENKCRIRVMNIFDGLPVGDIPWATPWKDSNGMVSNLPDKGKIVSVEFENGDIYSPVYRYAEHYNVNLENKLKDLNDEDYLSMKSILFDHKTQVYTNESEGLKLDHKFNLINITKDNINLNLKDKIGHVNIGTEDADQQAILGNNFLDWFDGFVSHLLGEEGGPYYGNLYAPIIPHPALIKHLAKYKASKDPKFLSHNVNFNDNNRVAQLDRINENVLGDDWKSTISKNDITTAESVNYHTPIESGPKEIYENEPANLPPPPPITSNCDGKEITELDYENAARLLKCEVAAVKAVAEVESAGSGFYKNCKPKILFEGHWFYRKTNGIYTTPENANISHKKWVRTYYRENQYNRLNKAIALDSGAALQSASWGKFQIMGFNYKVCGFSNVQDFVDAMYESEGQHLLAFVNFVKSKGLDSKLRDKDWERFAYGYNGSGYKENNYDVKMRNAYNRYT